MPSKKNSNKNNNKRKAPKKKTVRPMRVGYAGAPLSHCAMKYALAIADPWDPNAEGCCVPRHPSRPSYKVRGFARFTVTIGSGGVGFAQFIPCLANNAVCLVYTTSAYTGTSFVPVVSGSTSGSPNTVGVVQGFMSNLPFNIASMVEVGAYETPSVNGRLVSCSMSWQYTGTVSNMGGLCYSLVHPDHSSLNNIADSVPSFAETTVARTDAKRHWLGLSGIDDVECSYSEHHGSGSARAQVAIVCPFSNGEAIDGTNTTIGGNPAVVYFTGTAGNTFEVELVQHCEFTGISAQASVTPTHADSVGYETVQAASSRLPSLQAANPTTSRKSLMSQALSTVGRELAPVIRVGAENFIAAAARGVAGAAMGYITAGPPGAVYGGALGVSSGALRITNG